MMRSYQVSLEGQVASFWNGQSSTIITAEAPYQTGVEPIVVAVNATFIYCTEVRLLGSSNEEVCVC